MNTKNCSKLSTWAFDIPCVFMERKYHRVPYALPYMLPYFYGIFQHFYWIQFAAHFQKWYWISSNTLLVKQVHSYHFCNVLPRGDIMFLKKIYQFTAFFKTEWQHVTTRWEWYKWAVKHKVAYVTMADNGSALGMVQISHKTVMTWEIRYIVTCWNLWLHVQKRFPWLQPVVKYTNITQI